MSEQTALVCYRCADMPIPHVRAFKAVCTRCGEAVWIAYTSPPTDQRVCTRCLKVDDIKEMADFTPAQILDALAVINGPKQ